MTARLILICHGSTDALRKAAFPADEPLDAQGRTRAAALAGALPSADRYLTSPELRTQQTAEALSLDASVEASLRDCDYGSWSGRAFDAVYAREGLGHPGLLQRVMNKVLVDNAILGPWIHVGSRMQLLNAAHRGDELTGRAKVTDVYEKNGHRFVELDALVVGNGTTPLAHCHHVAIYQPREQAAA